MRIIKEKPVKVILRDHDLAYVSEMFRADGDQEVEDAGEDMEGGEDLQDEFELLYMEDYGLG